MCRHDFVAAWWGAGDTSLRFGLEFQFAAVDFLPAVALYGAPGIVDGFQRGFFLPANIQRDRAARRENTGVRALCQ